MIKPIFVVGIPRIIEGNEVILADVHIQLKNTLEDYHVISYITEENKPVCEGFYPKDFPEVEFEEFKKKVLNKIIQEPKTLTIKNAKKAEKALKDLQDRL